MRPRHANKVDSNHGEIVDWLRGHGCEVVDCSKAGEVPDLLVKHKDMVCWIEIKKPTKGDVRYTHSQLAWLSNTSYAVRIVSNAEDALDFARTHEGMLTAKEKNNLAIFCDSADKDKLFTVGQVQRAMEGVRF